MEESEKLKILITDDEEDLRDVLSIVLKDKGYDTAIAESGSSALSIFESISPQILITDIKMPGISGLELLEEVKFKWPDTEVIVITAFGEMEYAVKALQLNASDFITKPIDEDALLIAVKRAKERYKTRKELRDYTSFLEKENLSTSKELLRNYTYQKNLIESSIDGIITFDEEETIITFNRSMEEILKYREHEAAGKMKFSELFQMGDSETFREKLSGNEFGGENRLFLFDTKFISRSGEAVPVQVSASVIKEDTGKDITVCFIRDLREVKKLEREISDQAHILHQDKMMSLGRLAASVVHEINNPLFGVLNYVKLMSRIIKRDDITEDKKDKFRQYLSLVEKEIGRCSGIISNLLDFSRKSEPRFSPVKINELLDKSILLSRHKMELSNIKLIYKEEKSLSTVNGDFNQLQQCIINLIFNAVDAMGEGGTLEIGTELKTNKKELLIYLKDTGHGIDKKNIRSIFEPFFTTKKEGFGVGLGLSTVHGIIEHHKGRIEVESTLGKGTTFTIYLPL